MFTSAVGFGEHHFLGVNKTQCPPYEKSLIVFQQNILIPNVAEKNNLILVDDKKK
jgi:hypothetical protein